MASSLLAELAELRQTAPAEIEPELEDGDASAWATTSSAAPTRRMRRLDEDPKYQGRRVSRRQLENDDGLFLDGSSTAASKKGRRGMNSGRGQEDGDESDSEEEDGSASEEESDSEEESASEAVSEDDEDDDNEGPAETGKAARARAMLGGGGPDSSEAARMAREFEELEQEEAAAVQRLSTDVSAQVEKGRHAKNQLALWEALMELRIRMQRAVAPCNQLPTGDVWASVVPPGDDLLEPRLERCRRAVAQLSETLLDTQAELFGQFSTFSAAAPEGEAVELLEDVEAADSDAEEDHHRPAKRASADVCHRLEEELQARHKRFKPLLDSTIDKWNTKTRLASSRTDKSFKALDRRILDQITEVVADRERLVRRTQLQRTPAVIHGQAPPASEDTEPESNEAPEDDGDVPADAATRNQRDKAAAATVVYNESIFDDTDFYHELLRDLISRKTDMAAMDPLEMGRHWLEIDKLRTKIKRKVDTRASKGRKIRYDVHAKLVSFMTPNDTAYGATENAKDALCASLFADVATV